MSKKWETVEYPSRPQMVEGLLSFLGQGYRAETIDGLRTIAVLVDEEIVDELLAPAQVVEDGGLPEVEVPAGSEPAVAPPVVDEPAYSAPEPDPALVRAWAKENGIEVKGGFIAKAVIEQYVAAKAEEALL